MIRNDGTRLPISINTVLVQIIKEPQEIVCYQEEWGFSGIYPHVWYQNALRDGSLRMEVWLDPQNRLGEMEGLRHDNKAVLTWKFQY
jgi:hypothetical protein